MSAAQDRLEQAALEKLAAVAWRVAGITEADVDAILAVAESYAQVVAGRPARPVITLPEPLPVHLQSSPGRSACRAQARRLTRDPAKVTCSACPQPWAVALDEFIGEDP